MAQNGNTLRQLLTKNNI